MWKCSTSCDAGWEQPGFDDSAWPTSTDAGVNGVDPWGIREVSADAHWIWSEGTGVEQWKNGEEAGLDEGLLSFFVPVLVYMENTHRKIKIESNE
jgi:hypothetical protein